jgi:pilus assembly protein Flp/PilA
MEELNRLVAHVYARYLAPRHHDGEGATVVEYALLAALIAGVCLIAVTTFGKLVR